MITLLAHWPKRLRGTKKFVNALLAKNNPLIILLFFSLFNILVYLLKYYHIDANHNTIRQNGFKNNDTNSNKTIKSNFNLTYIFCSKFPKTLSTVTAFSSSKWFIFPHKTYLNFTVVTHFSLHLPNTNHNLQIDGWKERIHKN